MSKAGHNSTVFAVGGAVQASGGVYLERAADEELLTLCRAGDFGYVLTPRQLGKSSLMVRTAERLADEGARSVIIDLTEIGVQVTPEAWFLGLLVKVEDRLMLNTSAARWWAAHSQQGFAQRLIAFFKEVVLEEVREHVIVFIDEIDTTLSLSFTDDFYAAIRYFYNARAHTPAFRRLSFVLIGVATPGDLIRDPQRTPFNIGRRVDLTDFTYEEALPLAKGFQFDADETRRVLGWVLEWTGGHPYLTQRLCQAIADEGRAGWAEGDVARLVSATFLGEMSERDNNIQFVRDMLTKRAPDLAAVLTTYRAILRHPVADEEQSLVKSHLKLSGVVLREKGLLRVRNPIYREVFDEGWVRGHLPINWLRVLTRVAASLLLFLMLLAIPLAIYAWSQKAKAEAALASEKDVRQSLEQVNQYLKEARDEESEARLKAEESAGAAKVAETRALEAKEEAENQKRLAEEARAEALKQKQAAELARAEAIAQAERARKSESAAQAARMDAEAQKERAERLSKMALVGNLGALAEVTSSQQSRLLQQSILIARESVERSQQAPPILGYQALSRGLSLLPRPSTVPSASPYVGSARFSDDGKYLVTVESDPLRRGGEFYLTVRVFDASNNNEVDALRRVSLAGHTYFDESGKYMATIDREGKVSVTGLTDPAPPTTFKMSLDPNASELPRLIVSADGRHIAVIGKNVQVKNISGADEGPLLNPGDDELLSVALSPDGKTIALTSLEKRKNGILDFWNTEAFDVASGGQINAVGYIIPTGEPGREVLFSPNGQYLVMVDGYGITVYGLAYPGKKLWSKDIRIKESVSLAFSQDSAFLAVVYGDNTVRVLKASDGGEVATMPHDAAVTAIRFSRDGGYVATKSSSNMVRVWSTSGGREVARAIHRGTVTDFNFSPNGKMLVTSEGALVDLLRRSEPWLGPKSSLKVWDLTGEKSFVRRTLAESVLAATLSPDKKRLIVIEDAGGATSLHVWGMPRGRGISHEVKWSVADKPVRKEEGAGPPVLSFDGSYLVDKEELEETDGRTKVAVWNVANGRPREMFLKGGVDYPIAVSSDGEYFAATQVLNRAIAVLVYEVASGKEVARINGHSGDDLSDLAFSPDGKYLATDSEDGNGFVWDVKENREVSHFRHEDVEGQVLFSATGKYLVNAASGVQLWRRGTARPVTLARSYTDVFNKSSTDVNSVAFSSDERYVAAGGSDNMARVWETASGKLIAVVKHDGPVFSVALSEDGDYLATISEGNYARVWKVNSGIEVARIPHQSAESDEDNIAFSADGKYLLTSHNAGGAVEMWLWRPTDLLALSCELLTVDEPTPQVWQDYLGDDLAAYFLADPHEQCTKPR